MSEEKTIEESLMLQARPDDPVGRATSGKHAHPSKKVMYRNCKP